MKKKTLITFLCAGVLTVGAVTGLTGFADKEETREPAGEYTLLTVSETETDSGAVNTSTETAVSTGGITGVADVAAAVMPAAVSVTNTSVQEVENLYDMYGFGYWYGYGYGYGGRNGNGNTPRTYESVSVGSGIIIGQNDEELLICTNYHVIDDATEITVGFVDDSIVEAVIKGTDESSDLAVLAVSLEDISDDTMSAITIARIGDSDSLVVGEQVVAIGNALGYGQSVTTGIVSALNRVIDLDGYENIGLIQTDAAINGGNSGGALVDMNGNVVGINSAKVAESGVEGMGYSIPISYAKDILEDLMNTKTRSETVAEEDSSFIGISGQSVSANTAALYGMPQGIYITEVEEGSPADDAGLQKGDIIMKFDGNSVSSMSDLKALLAYYAAGEEVTITVSRASDGEYVESKIDLTLGALADYQS